MSRRIRWLVPIVAGFAAPALPAADTPAAPQREPHTLPNVVVIGTRLPALARDTLDSDALRAPGAADLGEVLRSISGVSAARMGGHGLEPVIRGQSQGQINVRIDGMELHGGCPNRMDPPTSLAHAASIDRVTVIKGVQTLRHGPGGGAGTVLIERDLPWRQPGLGLSTLLGAGDNVLDWQAGADAAWRGERAALRAQVSTESHPDYEDGDGVAVRSAYRRRTGNLMLGWEAADGLRFTLGAESARTHDAHYAGAGMDAPLDALDSLRIGAQGPLGAGEVEARAWDARVDHVMDNYSLRPLAGMAMRTPSSADTRGVFLGYGLAWPESGWSLTAALDHARTDRLAIRYAGPSPDQVTMPNALVWPDTANRRTGLLLEAEKQFDSGSLWRFGVRTDRFESDARRALEAPAPGQPSPATWYARYHGEQPIARSDDGLGALLRFEHALSPDLTAFAGASRSVRAPDATERYLASAAAMPAMRWIGNPGLVPETHQQLDAGLAWRGRRAGVSVVGFVDRIDEFILRDRARGQDGILLVDGASTYRNVDARLHGLELEGSLELPQEWRLSAQLAWVRGENLDDARALAQIPPLDLTLEARRATRLGEWSARLRAADRQDRVDADPATGSGLDARATPGFAVLDLGWRHRIGPHVLRVRLDNVFDRTYALHLNRANVDPFNPDAVQVNEPGRSLGLSWEWRFEG